MEAMHHGFGVCVGAGSPVGSALAAALQYFAATACLLNEPWPPKANIYNGSSFDYIVVGGGTAGATLAARLSEDPSVTVLLLEAGGNPPQESIIPGLKDLIKGGSQDWNFTTMDDHYSSQALRDGKQRQPRGKMLGGSGSINDMIYARGFPVDYEDWASIVGEDWNYDNVLQYFMKTERLTDEKIINDPELMKYHSRSGDIEVAGLNISTFTTDRFIEGFVELGFQEVKDMTHPNLIGVGRFSHTINDGKRDSSLVSLLNPASTRKNLHVLKNSLATKILINNNIAFGVQVRSNKKILEFMARKEVLLSAGTFNTAKLLLLSGIGPKEHLKDANIQVVQDLPVGKNLHDHVMVLITLAADSGTCDSDQATDHLELIRYLYNHTGSYSRTNSMGAYISFNHSTPNIPDFAIYPTCLPKKSNYYKSCTTIIGFKHDICLQLDEKNKDHEILTLAVVLLKPKSRGTVMLDLEDPFGDPLIYSGTFNDTEDLDGYPQAMKIAMSLVESSYFKSKNAHVVELKVEGCEGLKEDVWLRCLAQSMATSAWHAVGTAALGSVLDERLRVRGVRGLRVADASVMPRVIRGNTNAPVVMIAEKAADYIVAERRARARFG